jgi:putative endonuclease
VSALARTSLASERPSAVARGNLCAMSISSERLVICEVKTRSGTGYGEPAEAVTAAKAARIRRVAAQWLSTYRVGWCEIRFDIVAVMCPPDGPVAVEHFQGAF